MVAEHKNACIISGSHSDDNEESSVLIVEAASSSNTANLLIYMTSYP